MASPDGDGSTPERLRQEAAEWFARLNTRRIDAQTLQAFRVWRKAPGRRAAFAEIEAVYGRSAEVKDAPEIRAALEAALARGPRKGRRRLGAIVLASAAAVTVAAIIAVVGAWPPTGLPNPLGKTYATTIGEQRNLRLADGSRLWLDTDTRVTVHFKPQTRTITITQGQALFEVAHAPERPFKVVAGDTEVVALGTRFDVRRGRSGEIVTLLEGEVEVRKGPDQVRLRPGQQIVATQALSQPQAVNLKVASSWTEGRIIFEATPLADAIEEVNRYSQRKINLAAPDAADDPISGAFETGDVTAFAAAVAQLHGLKVVSQGSQHITLAQGTSQGAAP